VPKYVLFLIVILLWIMPKLIEPLNDDMVLSLHFINGCLIQVALSSIILISGALGKKYKIILFSVVVVVNILFLFNYVSVIFTKTP